MDNPDVLDAQRWLPERLIWLLADNQYSPIARTQPITPILDRRILLP